MDQPKLERMLRLMMMLTANTSYTVEDLAERLDMSRRTIYRYIDTFREAGFLIKRTGNYIRLDKASPHFKEISQLVHFTEEEAQILKRAIESVDDTNILKQNLKRKLYSVYDNKLLANTVVKGHQATTVHRLIEAIEGERQVVLKGYRSAHGGRTSDRRVEPFSFTTNYIHVWCYDPESGACKSFKSSRIGEVLLLDEPWQHKERHQEAFTDIFRMNGEGRYPICLEMGLRGYNLLLEEYPLAERDLKEVESGRWQLRTEVANYAGVGRFVAGLLDDVKVVESPELTAYLDNYFKQWTPKKE